ncbi:MULTISPECIES: type VI secretion protein [unclassified Pseudomonas]|nr:MULTISPECIES: type VI secretion protein [unclassified Pseudomonas]MPQ71084.1 type VI secretion protein [Pseudomonas sp. MWU12-2323]
MPTFLTVFFMVLTLAGCTGNYRFSDPDYRALGDPNALQRNK